MKRLLLLTIFILTFLLPIAAESVRIGNLYYELNRSNRTAEVTYKAWISNDSYVSGSLTIPKAVTYGNITFSVTSIGEDAFYKCYRLTSVTIPNSVKSIEEKAFSHCSGLTSVNIPNSVTEIESEAFNYCSGLTSVTIPNSVKSIGWRAFNGCSGLKKVVINDVGAWCKIKFETHYSNPLEYAHSLYINNKEIKDLVIPNSVTEIGFVAFHGCSGLTSVTIPNSVAKIGGDAFSGCSGLKKVVINDVGAWCKIKFSNSDSNPLSYAHSLYLNDKEIKDLVIPNSITEIGEYAFYGCSGLTSVTIPNSVKSIGGLAFEGCSGLTSVTIPNSVIKIGGYAFSGCSGLTSVTIPNSVTEIGEYAFYGCSGLTSVTIPNSVKSIGGLAFSGCSGLTSVTIPNSVKKIEISVFEGCSGLTSVTIPNSVKSIGHTAFKGCSGLTSVTIPNSVTVIGEHVFSGCYKLKRVYLLNPDLRGSDFPRNSEIIRNYTWQDFNKNLLSWERYYQQNKKNNMTFNSINEIQKAVNKEIEEWQKKGEFETTAEWQQRVNENTRQEKINTLNTLYLDRYNSEKKDMETEQHELLQSYERYKKMMSDEYYGIQALMEESKFTASDFELRPYDADNNTFLISSELYSDILLLVPRDEAPDFKENWESIKRNVKPVFVPNGETVVLNKVIFNNGGREYVSDIKPKGK